MPRRPPKPKKRTTLDVVRVHRSPLDRRRGVILAGPLALPCALGRSGPARSKREGDGTTPVGRFRVLQAFYRPDRVRRPRTRLPVGAIGMRDGWCDDPADRNYNRPVRLPYPGRHERMRREDGLYDVVVDLAYNRGPIRKGRGSAIFLHCAKPGLAPTEGCIALASHAARRLLEQIGPRTVFVILPESEARSVQKPLAARCGPGANYRARSRRTRLHQGGYYGRSRIELREIFRNVRSGARQI